MAALRFSLLVEVLLPRLERFRRVEQGSGVAFWGLMLLTIATPFVGITYGKTGLGMLLFVVMLIVTLLIGDVPPRRARARLQIVELLREALGVLRETGQPEVVPWLLALLERLDQSEWPWFRAELERLRGEDAVAVE